MILFQHLGVSGKMNLLVASVAVGLLKLKNGSASTTAELQLNVRAWTRRSFSVIHNHVVSFFEWEQNIPHFVYILQSDISRTVAVKY